MKYPAHLNYEAMEAFVEYGGTILNHCLYRPDRKHIAITNGQMMVVLPVEPDVSDEPCCIPLNAFDLTGVSEYAHNVTIDTSDPDRIRIKGGQAERIINGIRPDVFLPYEKPIERALRLVEAQAKCHEGENVNDEPREICHPWAYRIDLDPWLLMLACRFFSLRFSFFPSYGLNSTVLTDAHYAKDHHRRPTFALVMPCIWNGFLEIPNPLEADEVP